MADWFRVSVPDDVDVTPSARSRVEQDGMSILDEDPSWLRIRVMDTNPSKAIDRVADALGIEATTAGLNAIPEPS